MIARENGGGRRVRLLGNFRVHVIWYSYLKELEKIIDYPIHVKLFLTVYASIILL